MTNEEPDPKLRCDVCRSEKYVHRFAIAVDGVELASVVSLCATHGEVYLLGIGMALGMILAPGAVARASTCERCGNPCHPWQRYCGGACSAKAEAGE